MAQAMVTLGLIVAAIGLLVCLASLHSRWIGRRWIGYVVGKSRYADAEDRAKFNDWAINASGKGARIGAWLVLSGLAIIAASFGAALLGG